MNTVNWIIIILVLGVTFPLGIYLFACLKNRSIRFRIRRRRKKEEKKKELAALYRSRSCYNDLSFTDEERTDRLKKDMKNQGGRKYFHRKE